MPAEELSSSAAPKGFCHLLMARAISIVAVLCMLCAVAGAQPPQRRPVQFARARAAQTAAPPGNASPQRPGWVRSPGPHRGDWLRKYGDLPSDQARKQLQQDKDKITHKLRRLFGQGIAVGAL